MPTPQTCSKQCSDAYLAAQQAGDWGGGKAIENYRLVDNRERGVGVAVIFLSAILTKKYWLTLMMGLVEGATPLLR